MSQITDYLQTLVSKGAKFIAFTYTKDDHSVSERNILINVNIEKAQVKRGDPLKNKSAWMSGCREGRNGFLIVRGGVEYLSGYENGKVLKNFKVSGISNLRAS